MDTQRQRDSALMAEVGVEAGDGHRAVDRHLMLFAVFCYLEGIWRKLRTKKGSKV